MKRKILIVLIIITMFLTGKNSVYAEEQSCSAEVYTNKCKYVNYDSNFQEMYLYYNQSKTWIVQNYSFSNGNTTQYFYYNINNEDEKNVYYVTGNYQQKEEDCKKIAEVEQVYYNNISVSQLTNGCPQKIYGRISTKYVWYINTNVHYTEWNTKFYDDPELPNTSTGSVGERFETFVLFNDENANKPQQPTTPSRNNKSCNNLLSEDLIQMINSVMDVVKIGVPILLLGLLIYDFATAVFAGSDD